MDEKDYEKIGGDRVLKLKPGSINLCDKNGRMLTDSEITEHIEREAKERK